MLCVVDMKMPERIDHKASEVVMWSSFQHKPALASDTLDVVQWTPEAYPPGLFAII